MAKYSYYTEEGLEKLQNELKELTTKGRSEMAKTIAEARDKGDLSENAEYDAAKDAQGLLELKISELKNKVASARIIDESNIDPDRVSILSTVKIKNKKNGMEVTYSLVPEEEASISEGRISIESPIAQGLLGKRAGQLALVKVPAGELEFEVIEVSR